MSTITYIIVVLSISAIANTELVCPGYGFVKPQEPCVDKCSPNKDRCSKGKKCCYSPLKPCGYHCLIAKNNVAKNGTCPSPTSEQNNLYWGVCDLHFCDVDNDCTSKEKCCPNPCGAPICINPQ